MRSLGWDIRRSNTTKEISNARESREIFVVYTSSPPMLSLMLRKKVGEGGCLVCSHPLLMSRPENKCGSCSYIL